MSFGSNILNSKPSLEYIIDNIIGYSTLIDTPFGRLCSVYADHTATGRPFRPIENLIQKKIKPMIANSHTESSEMGAFSTKLLSYAQASILKSFNVTNKSHFSLPTGYGATGAFERLAKILRIEEIKKEKICSPSKCLEDIPLIIISPYEHHSNILPWQACGCNIKTADSDQYGNMNLAKFESLLFNNVNSKLIIVSFSATSNVTSQRTDLAGINSIIKKFKKEKLPPSHKFFFIVDCAAFCSHDRLDLSGGSKYDEIDFVCMSPHKHLGGSEAVGVLLVRLEAYDQSLPPSFPGGGTVKAVTDIDEQHIWYDDDPSVREMPGTPNAIGMYRAALTFELQDWIGLDFIKSREEENAKYFFEQIQIINEEVKNLMPPRNIIIYGDHNHEIRFDVFSFNIIGPGTMTDVGGKTLFHPHFVSKVLNDVFAIQVRSGCSCAGPYGVKLLNIPQRVAEQIVDSILEGYEDVKPGWVRLDTFFTFQEYELKYIIQAIRLVAKYGERIQRFYEQVNGQFFLKKQAHKVLDFNLLSVINSNVEEVSMVERQTYLKNQIEQGEMIMKNPKKYVEISDQNQDQLNESTYNQSQVLDIEKHHDISNKSSNILENEYLNKTVSKKGSSTSLTKNDEVIKAEIEKQLKQNREQMYQEISNVLKQELKKNFGYLQKNTKTEGDDQDFWLNPQASSSKSKYEKQINGIFKNENQLKNENQFKIRALFSKYQNEEQRMTYKTFLYFVQQNIAFNSLPLKDIQNLFKQCCSNRSDLSIDEFIIILEEVALIANRTSNKPVQDKINTFYQSLLNEQQKNPTQNSFTLNINPKLSTSNYFERANFKKPLVKESHNNIQKLKIQTRAEQIFQEQREKQEKLLNFIQSPRDKKLIYNKKY